MQCLSSNSVDVLEWRDIGITKTNHLNSVDYDIFVDSCSFFTFQLNYEYLRKCVTSGPVTPMPHESWERIIKLLPTLLRTSPLTSPLLPQLHRLE